MIITIPTKEKVMEEIISKADSYTAIYARESNPSVDTALDAQVITCRRCAVENNLIVYDIYKEFVSASQKTYLQRKEFKRLIEDARKGHFKKIIVTKRDRLTRRFEDFIEIKGIFKELGVEIIYSNDVQLNETTEYAGKFIESLVVALSEFEPQYIKERTQRGMEIKREKRLYDRQASYGLYLDTSKREYVEAGVKSDIVKDVFDIYLNNRGIKKTSEVINELRKRSLMKYNNEKNEKDKRDKKEEYEKLVNNLKAQSVRDIICRPIYAGLQTKTLKLKYENFKVYHEGKELDVEPQYFHECTNVNKLIQPNQWYEAVQKWIENNPVKKYTKKLAKKRKSGFYHIFYCKTCNQKIRDKDNILTCGTKGCVRINKDKLLKIIVEQLVNSLIKENKIDDVINEVVLKFKKRKLKLQNIVSSCIKEQGNLVEQYVVDSSNEQLKEKIKGLTERQVAVKYVIDNLEDRILFLQTKFKEVIIPIVQSEHINLIIDDLQNSQYEIFEMFIKSGIKELDINGRCITVRDER
jgi:DNA invertase Pin-like site-specific DNA recombinase